MTSVSSCAHSDFFPGSHLIGDPSTADAFTLFSVLKDTRQTVGMVIFLNFYFVSLDPLWRLRHSNLISLLLSSTLRLLGSFEFSLSVGGCRLWSDTASPDRSGTVANLARYCCQRSSVGNRTVRKVLDTARRAWKALFGVINNLEAHDPLQLKFRQPRHGQPRSAVPMSIDAS